MAREREVVARVAEVPLTVPVPRLVAPSKNSTDPVAPVGTVAVKVTEAPYVDGFRFEASVVVLSALFTTWVTAEEVDPLKFVSPP